MATAAARSQHTSEAYDADGLDGVDGVVSPTPRRTYVLDTSVLLADPGALRRFAEHEVVLPVVVITELEGKRHHPELG